MIRTVNVSEITAAVKEMCIEANHFLSEDMAERMKLAVEQEEYDEVMAIKPMFLIREYQ